MLVSNPYLDLYDKNEEFIKPAYKLLLEKIARELGTTPRELIRRLGERIEQEKKQSQEVIKND